MFGRLSRVYSRILLAVDVGAGAAALFVAYYRRGLARFLKVKELVDTQAIGDIRFVTTTFYSPPQPDELDPETLPWRVKPEIAGGGRFVDLASHLLDFLDYILGPIKSVQGFAANQGGLFPAEDIVSSAYQFESGVQGVCTWCFTAFDDLDRTEIVGSKGKITFSTFDANPVLLTTQQGTTEFTIDYPAHVQQPLIQTVVNSLTDTGTCPSTGQSAARTNWVMDEMLKAYRN